MDARIDRAPDLVASNAVGVFLLEVRGILVRNDCSLSGRFGKILAGRVAGVEVSWESVDNELAFHGAADQHQHADDSHQNSKDLVHVGELSSSVFSKMTRASHSDARIKRT